MGWRPPPAAIPPHLQLRRVYELWTVGYRRRRAPISRARAIELDRNERLAGQVTLALHRGGRQADALRYFEQVRPLTRLRRTTDEPADGVFRP